jgi:hypothetical protein
MHNKRIYKILVASVCAYFSITAAYAANVITIDLRDNIFEPSVITISENTKIKLIIVNHDDSPEEFDSFDLNREKVIFANSSAILFIGPLPKGTYHFFGEYHPETAIGKVIVTNCETMRIESSEEIATC